MTDTSNLIKQNIKAELALQNESLLLKSAAISNQIKTIEEQARAGTELVSVYLDPIARTNPFGSQFDPYMNQQMPGYTNKPSQMSFKLLRSIAKKTEPVSAIIKLRTNQVGAFSHISDDINKPGFRVMLTDKAAKPTPEEIEEMKMIEQFMLNTGFEHNPDRSDNFESVQRKLVKDRLTLDAISLQLVANKRGELSEFWVMDAGTIAFATEDYMYARRDTYQPIKFVQVSNGQVMGEFTALELAYGVANPSSEISSLGYGESELELLIEVITSYLFSRDYNKSFFTKNSVPAGILSLTGKYRTEELDMFKRQWAAQVQGVNNAWRVPIMASEDGKSVDFKTFKTSNKEAEFQKWMDFLIKITAAVYQTSPEEINFSMGSAGGDSPMIAKEGGQAILASKDRGLVPLLRFLQNFYNSNIIRRINPKYKFVFTGVEPKDQEKDIDLTVKKKFFTTVNEIRAAEDRPGLTLMVGDINIFDMPDNPTVLNMVMALKQATDLEKQTAAANAQQGTQPMDDGTDENSSEDQGIEEDLDSPEEV